MRLPARFLTQFSPTACAAAAVVRVINPKITAEDNTCARVSGIPQEGARVVEVLRPTGLK